MQRISAKVGVLNDDGSIKSVNVTFRGEPEFTGRVLRDHFTDDVSIAKLYEKASINIIRTKDRWGTGISEDNTEEILYWEDSPEEHPRKETFNKPVETFDNFDQFYFSSYEPFYFGYIYSTDTGWKCYRTYPDIMTEGASQSDCEVAIPSGSANVDCSPRDVIHPEDLPTIEAPVPE
jgi:ubiquinone/menaquinone biosynthesis C-methylase UbiE